MVVLSGHLAHASMHPHYVHINGAGFSWALKKGQRGTPMLELMAHELGHNLGLSHTHGSGDLMRPSNRRMSYEIVHFSATDKQRIQAIHGAPIGGGGGKRKGKKGKRRKRGKKRRRGKKRKNDKRKRRTKKKRRKRPCNTFSSYKLDETWKYLYICAHQQLWNVIDEFKNKFTD